MIAFPALAACLDDLGLGAWMHELEPLLRERMSDSAHGDFAHWRESIDSLPTIARPHGSLNSQTVTVGPKKLDGDTRASVRAALSSLSPWRKGPFNVCGITIDAEWRSDLKWRRLENAIAPLEGRNVLDVGSGNGYYALRMRGVGAKCVIGIDPTILYAMQFAAVSHFMPTNPVFVLPLRLHELPAPARAFDTTFSMGVLYHQRSPIDHLRQLKQTLRPGGQLVLESIFVPGEQSYACTPADRYARMKNVWLLPTIAELKTWLGRTGYRDIAVIDETITTSDEQRTTEWMPFESLAESLDPNDPTRTVEGWPAPRRVIVLAIAP